MWFQEQYTRTHIHPEAKGNSKKVGLKVIR